jgi:uncharacterized protein DUF732
MITASEPTSVHGDGAATSAVPGGVTTGDADLVWAMVDTVPDVAPRDRRRPLPKTVLAFVAAIGVAGVALGAFVFGDREPESVNTLTPVAQSPSHEVRASVVTPAAKRAPVVPNTAPEPGATVTIEALAPAATEIPPSLPALSSQFDRSRDQWLLDNLRSLGYTIINPARVISSAYQACRLFEQGEPPEQVNQQMSAMTGLNIDDTLQLTSSAMLAYYPNCA